MKQLLFLLTAFPLITGLTGPSSPASPASRASAAEIQELELDTVANVIFWRKIMNLESDSCLVNIHRSRTILATMHAPSWYAMEPEKRNLIVDSLKRMRGITDTTRVVGTLGKKSFYAFEKVADKIPKGMDAFEKNDVDGWYAKAILLIESPGKLQKSVAGAYGPFQLMPGVARNYGLRVNRKVDERANFNRSAYAASRLIREICIPYASRILDERGIAYEQTDLWFKLFVMHVYNAGAGNVRQAVDAIPVPLSGMGLIQQLWITSSGRFQSSSQNYSQLILAAFLEYEDRVANKS